MAFSTRWLRRTEATRELSTFQAVRSLEPVRPERSWQESRHWPRLFPHPVVEQRAGRFRGQRMPAAEEGIRADPQRRFVWNLVLPDWLAANLLFRQSVRSPSPRAPVPFFPPQVGSRRATGRPAPGGRSNAQHACPSRNSGDRDSSPHRRSPHRRSPDCRSPDCRSPLLRTGTPAFKPTGPRPTFRVAGSGRRPTPPSPRRTGFP